MRSKPLLVALALLAAVALALPTVATPLTDPVGDGVTITTANSANAEYVSAAAGDRLLIDFSDTNPALDGTGVNPDARTYVADVFRIRYDGDRPATVWLDGGPDGVAFRARDDRLDSPTTAVTLGPDESVAVGVVVDTTAGRPAGGGAVTVQARVAAPGDGSDGSRVVGASEDSTETPSIRVERPDVGSRRVTIDDGAAGRSATLALDLGVARAGGGALTLEALSVVGDGGSLELDVDATTPERPPADASVRSLGAVRIEERRGGVERATLRFGVDRAYLDAVGVAPSALTMYRFDEGRRSELGLEVVVEREGRIVLDTETPGFSTFTVAADAPDIRITAAELEPTTVAPDGRATVTAEVTNAGAAAGERTVRVTLDGESVGTRRVALSPDESASVTFRVAPTDVGAHTVRVGPVDAGRLVVESDGSENRIDPPGSATGSPGAVDSGDGTPRPRSPVPEPAGGSPIDVLRLVAVLGTLLAITALARRLRT